MKTRWPLLAAILFCCGARPLHAQLSGETLSTAGVHRAAGVVNAVFVDRELSEAVVSPADFGSYLLARVGVIPIPHDLTLRVAVDTGGVSLRGTVSDLPAEARAELGPLLGMFGPDARLSGRIRLDKVAREVFRFRLMEISVNGIPLPEIMLATVMLDVAKRYPVLGRTGRDLLVQVPRDAEIFLEPYRVRLIGPPAATLRQ